MYVIMVIQKPQYTSCRTKPRDMAWVQGRCTCRGEQIVMLALCVFWV